MPAERIFMNWDRPCLHVAVDYLYGRYRKATTWDMSGVLVATQGARAARRLVELLAERTAEIAETETVPLLMTPPRTVTVGRLPEELYDSDGQVPSSLESLLARLSVLRDSAAIVSDLLPHPPPSDDLMAWVRIAEEFGRLQDDLESEAIGSEQISEIGVTQFGIDDHKRWDAIAAIDSAYCGVLGEAGLHSRHEARTTALKAPLQSDFDIVLVAAVDLPGVTRQFLNAVRARVTALVWAPDDQADRFDDLGCVIADRWQDVQIPLAGGIDIVNRPVDQATRIVARAAAIGAKPEKVLTVALGDESLGPTVQRLLELSDIKARRSVGRDASTTGPALMLESIGEYVGNRTPQTLAALLRQPDIANLFREAEGGGSNCWIASLDTIAATYLPAKLDCDWASVAADADIVANDTSVSKRDQYAARDRARDARAVMAAIKACDDLISPLGSGKRTLTDWSPLLSDLLSRIYNGRQFDGGDPEQAGVIRALQALALCLEGQRMISPAPGLAVSMTAGDAILFTLKQLAARPIPDPAEEMAVEVIGWLDGPLDDAPVLVVAGLNEGFLPQSVSADVLLPNRMRAALGLLDNKRRYARDAFLLCAAAHSRGANLHIVAGRLTADGDPLRPSRLLFACDEDEMVKRALKFYDEKATPPPSIPLLAYGNSNDLATIPRPLPLEKPITKVSPTAFADYLGCRYRFYLNRVVRLDAPNEDCEEMDPLMFGSLAHEVFRRFAVSALKDSTDEAAIASLLASSLADAAREQFGNDLLPAVEIQLRQLRTRLDRFAALQAQMVSEGWTILHSECDLEIEVFVDGVATIVGGRVDRVDYNPAMDTYRVIDYKTGDAGDSPEATHRQTKDGARIWVGLQLPLYRRLVGMLGIEPEKVELGYILLPKRTENVAYSPAKWTEDDFRSADLVVEQVLRDIRAEWFWPPSDTVPKYADGLETICMDACPDRSAIILSSKTPMAPWLPAKKEGVG